jgi:hypothetical protein
MTDIKKLAQIAGSQAFLRGTVLLLACAALLLNLLVSVKTYGPKPLREAASRSLMAANSSWFYDSGLAEPVPVAALKLAMAAGADPEKAVRAQGLALFVLIFSATLFTLYRRYGDATAIFAAFFLAANPFLGYYATQGSSQLYALFFLLLFWHYFDSQAGGRRHALLAGLWGGLACLSRLDAALPLLAVVILTLAVRRGALPLKESLLALGLALLLVLPYAARQKAEYGNFLYAQELSLRRWANIDKFGYEPAADKPQGPLGPAAFLLRSGAPGALQDAFSGLGRSLSYELPRIIHYKVLIVLVFLGVYAAFALARDRLLIFAAAVLLPVLPLAAIKQVPSTGGIELRYYLPVLWALCALAALGLQETMDWGARAAARWAEAKTDELNKRYEKKTRNDIK